MSSGWATGSRQNFLVCRQNGGLTFNATQAYFSLRYLVDPTPGRVKRAVECVQAPIIHATLKFRRRKKQYGFRARQLDAQPQLVPVGYANPATVRKILAKMNVDGFSQTDIAGHVDIDRKSVVAQPGHAGVVLHMVIAIKRFYESQIVGRCETNDLVVTSAAAIFLQQCSRAERRFTRC